MSQAEDTAELSPVKRALLEVRALRARIAELEAQAREPIAIVGMSVRAPGGVTDIAGLAELLWAGRDAITEIPSERWPLADWFAEAQDAPGKMYTRFGGFLDDVTRFDAEFFGIAPVEAASMDPQQRLVLELSWEALEHANHAPASLAGTRAGIYLGVSNSDYGRALFAQPELIDPYFSAGNAFSVAAGRVAYVLGCHGPAIAVDTACSSSLVSLHLAVQGLRHGDCDLALAGGVNLILTPELNVNFSKAGMMARDGRCRTFDAAASGYVRGEGGGMVVLRRLRDALSAGDRVLAVIRGTAVNQDGRSNGLTAPNGPAQQAVLRAALSDAGIPARLVSYVEAHGTGTSLGDPIEVGALAAVLSEGREPSATLSLGSVKTNIGHLEAAAGIVGVIKTVLALECRELPPHLHLHTRNPFIDWNALPIAIPTAVTPWAPIDGRYVAGVSAFGFSGTNAHVVLEAAPAAPQHEPRAPRAEILALSARNPQALRELAQCYRDALAALPSTVSARDVCCSANVGRTHFASRLSVQGATVTALVEGLEHWLRGEADPRVVLPTASDGPSAPRVAFLYPGQGPQYAGMGRELYDHVPVFRRAFDECAAELERVLGGPITSIVFPADGNGAPLDRTENAQPAMFALEYALSALWRAWGVQPAAVMGHSFGEYAAACLAGVLSLADAARIVVARGRLAALAPGDGVMMILEASGSEVAAAIAEAGGALSIAALNGPTNTVISGERGAVERVAATFTARGRRATPLRVSHAFHSPLMDSVLPGFERELAGVRYGAPSTTLISNLTGEAADLETLGHSAYWRDHLRQPVRFAHSIQVLAGKGITHYVELSPHPVLLGMGADCVAGGTWLPSMRKEHSARAELLHTLQVLYADGFDVNWSAVSGAEARRSVSLPTYPFQRTRHWIELPHSAQPGPATVDLWAAVLRNLERESARGPLDLNVASYPEKWACLARLTDATVLRTLRELGAFDTVGERHSLESVLRTTGIVSGQQRLLSRWLTRLVQAGALRRDGEIYEARSWQPAPLGELWAEAAHRFSDNRELLAYVRNCADQLSGIVTGRVSPLESLFPGGSFELATALYERSATMRYINALAAAAIGAASQALPLGSALRVLEIGGGTGGTTSALLRALPAEGARYRFTDVSEAFMSQARARFAAYPSLEFGTFDLELDPERQGYVPGSFDVIVSANCVHAATDLRAALGRIRHLLAPGGVLILVESTVHLDYFDMTTGLIEGWQHFTDDLRGDDPLLPPDTWVEALRAAGMADAKAWPMRGAQPEILGQHVIVAVNAGRAESQPRARSSTAVDAAWQSAPSGDAEPAPVGVVRRRLEAELPSEHLAILCDVVRAEVVRILRLDPTAPPARHERLMELGMDSLMAVQLRNALDRAMNFERDRGLPSTLMFDYPTIEAIAEFLRQRVAPSASAAAAPSAPRARVAEPAPLDAAAIADLSDDDIASLLEQRGRP